MPSYMQLNLHISTEINFSNIAFIKLFLWYMSDLLCRPYHWFCHSVRTVISIPIPWLLLFSHSLSVTSCILLTSFGEWSTFILFYQNFILTLLFSMFSSLLIHCFGLPCILLHITFWLLFYSVIYYSKKMISYLINKNLLT